MDAKPERVQTYFNFTLDAVVKTSYIGCKYCLLLHSFDILHYVLFRNLDILKLLVIIIKANPQNRQDMLHNFGHMKDPIHRRPC